MIQTTNYTKKDLGRLRRFILIISLCPRKRKEIKREEMASRLEA